MFKKPLSIQPIPYQGSKRALAPRICSIFPNNIKTLYEPFAGSAAITLFAAKHDLAEKFIIGDVCSPIINLWSIIINNPKDLSERYSEIWNKQFESSTHFNNCRSEFNENNDPVLLLYLIARCVKNAVRFNKKGFFTQSADKRRTGMHPDRMTRTVHAVSNLLKGRTSLFNGDFYNCIENATDTDLIYMDPPYQGTTYGSDKRYASGLERERIIEILHKMDQLKTRYILSYDGRTGDKHYGDPLPNTINAAHILMNAGRSSQATINGLSHETIESLYVSRLISLKNTDIYHHNNIKQYDLFK